MKLKMSHKFMELLTKDIPKNLVKIQSDRLNLIIQNEITESLEHFKNHGWDLNADFIYDDVMSKFFGNDIKGYVLAKIATGLKCNVVYSGKGAFFNSENPPLYYDTINDQIVESANLSEGLPYQYEHIGVL